MHDIQDIMFAMEEEWNEQESEAKQDFQSLRDEIKNKVGIVFLEFSILKNIVCTCNFLRLANCMHAQLFQDLHHKCIFL